MKASFYFIFLFLSFHVLSQKDINAKRTNKNIKIDGILNENSWTENTSIASNFTQLKPFPGNPITQITEVKVIYDDDAIYIGAICYDYKDSISKVISFRDQMSARIDLFGLFIDTYNDAQNGFFFGVTSRNVQSDAKIAQESFNFQFNLAWKSQVQITEDAWTCEIKIPYSALRFPKKDIQNWGINFGRSISRNREESYWNTITPDMEDLKLVQCGNLKGLEGINPPLRLAFMPYVSAYIDEIASGDGKTLASSFNGGMDIKYGINEALTLDVTLVPDFGQVVFDKQVLNISPFEMSFNENRQFFTEGTELFNKAGLFYSRRIGVQPNSDITNSILNENEILSQGGQNTRLINASKLSGRLKNGLGIGFFNGINDINYGTAVDTTNNQQRAVITSPLTNFNVFVLDQNLKNNSSITFTNTNVWRSGHFYDANVSGLDFNLNSKSNDYFIDGYGSVSAKVYESDNDFGHEAGITLGKQRGNFVFNAEYFEQSDSYDINDLGFNRVNNKRNIEIEASYRNFTPKWEFANKIFTRAAIEYKRLYNPNEYIGTYFRLNGTIVSKYFHAGGIRMNGSLTESYDFFEAREWGSYFIRPTWITTSAWFSSNYQKRYALDFRFRYTAVQRENWNEYGYAIENRFLITKNIFLYHQWSQDYQFNSQGFAVENGLYEPNEQVNNILFGNRNRINSVNSIRLDYGITNRMGIVFSLRHYNSMISYNSFYNLLDNGRLEEIPYSGNDLDGNSAYDINFNAFTIDFQYRWIFSPGSELSFVWKNSIFIDDENVNRNYLNNLQYSLTNGPLNSISIKLMYWLDYSQIKKAFSNRKQNS